MQIRLSENIRALRRRHGLTQEQLAEALGMTPGAVYKWEAGLSQPELAVIVELADLFQVSMDVLVGYELRNNDRESVIERLKQYVHDRDHVHGSDPVDAISDVEKALQRYPNCFEIVYRSARIYRVKGLYLKKSVLKAGREYGIYVTYPGGSTGVYTFVYGGELISNEHWYKRNYADRDGKELPDIDNETERVTDTSAILVGNRLLDLMKNGVKLIPFEGDGVLVRVPVEVVKDWNIKAEDQIETDISWVGSDVSVKISKNGEAVTDIPGATVEIPYANRDSQTMLTDEEGNSYTGSVNDAQNAEVIPIDKTGDYTVEEQPQNQTENGGNTEEDDPEGDSLENAADSGEEKLSEQVEELLSEDVKNQKANSDENLNSQHKKTASIVIIIVILLILLWNIPMRRGKKLRKGERGEGEQSK